MAAFTPRLEQLEHQPALALDPAPLPLGGAAQSDVAIEAIELDRPGTEHLGEAAGRRPHRPRSICQRRS